MPIKRMFEGRNFEPKAAAVLVEALNSVVADLDSRTVADRKRAAKIVIELAAGRGSLDAAELRDVAIGLMRNESGELGHDFDHGGGLRGP